MQEPVARKTCRHRLWRLPYRGIRRRSCSGCTFRPVAGQFLTAKKRGAFPDVQTAFSSPRCMARAEPLEMGRALSAAVLSGRLRFRRGRRASVQHDNSRAPTPRTSLAKPATLLPHVQGLRNPFPETSEEPPRIPSYCHPQNNELPVGRYFPNRRTIALWAYTFFA